MENAKIVNTEIVFNKFKKLVKETLVMDDGNEIDWVYLDTPRSVVIIPVTEQNELVLVRQYRHNLKRYVDELPAGGVEEEDSSELEAAKRELIEETGYDAKEFIDLGKYYVLPSETNRWTRFILAKGAFKVQEPKADNFIEKYFNMSVKTESLDSFTDVSAIGNNDVVGVETLFGIKLAESYLNRNK